MTRIVAAVLRGPDDPAWPIAERAAQSWADDFVILDDETGNAWGREHQFREKLWTDAIDAAGSDGWVFVLDTDFVLTFDPHDLVDGTQTSIWLFRLYDLWSPTHYRSDDYWHAHDNPRPWLFRAAMAPESPVFSDRGIHTGHYPLNMAGLVGVAPRSHAILHLGWMTPEVREQKWLRYQRVWDQLRPTERAHAETIMDDDPTLEPLPPDFAAVLSKNLTNA